MLGRGARAWIRRGFLTSLAQRDFAGRRRDRRRLTSGIRPRRSRTCSLLPNGTDSGAENDDAANEDEPGQKGEDNTDGSVQLAVVDDHRREVDRGEDRQNEPEHGGGERRPDEQAPSDPSRQQEMHRPPEEARDDHEAEERVEHWARRPADRLPDRALGDQKPEQDADPGDETRQIAPPPVVLVKEPLVDHL